MAINIPIISDFTDAGIKNARIAFQNFKTKVSEAEGAMNKFKVGAGAALDYVKNNAGVFAAAAGTAVLKFAGEAITAFQDTALAAGELSAKTGLAVEDASRWMEVAGDLGVNIDGVESAMGKLARTIGSNPDVLRDLGDDAVYLDGGALDVNATFLNVIQRLKDIKDPAERAREGARLLGKGWQDMALLIEAGAGPLSESLASVSKAKVIDPDELQRARDFRDAMDNLKDKFEEVQLTVGEKLVPVITDLLTLLEDTFGVGATIYGDIKDGFDSIGETGKQVFKDLGLASDDFEKGLEAVITRASEQTALKDMWIQGYEAMRIAEGGLEDLNSTLGDTEEATWQLNDAWKALLTELDLESAFRDAAGALVELNQKAAEAFADPTKFDDYKDQQDEVIKKFAQIMGAMELTSAEQNRVKFLVDTGNLEGALDLLNAFNEAAVTGRPVPKPTPFVLQRRALGGPVMDGVPYLVGERGPELFVPGQSGTIVPNNAMGGGTINVTVTSADPNEVVRALQTYVRQSGPVPVNTRTM